MNLQQSDRPLLRYTPHDAHNLHNRTQQGFPLSGRVRNDSRHVETLNPNWSRVTNAEQCLNRLENTSHGISKVQPTEFPRETIDRSNLHTTKNMEPEMNDVMEITDEQLFAGYVAGDEEAFNALHARYEGALRRYVRLKTGFSETDVDEVVQLVFIRVVKNKDRFIEGKSVKPWLYTIADRLSRDAKQLQRNRRRHTVSLQDFKAPGNNEHSDSLENQVFASNHVPPSADIVENGELGAKAMKLLRRLPTHLRNTVQLAVLQELPNRASGPLMNISHMQVHNRLKMALDILRKQMESEDTNEIEDTILEELNDALLDDCLEALPRQQYLAVERIILDQPEATKADGYIFATFIRRLVGEAI